jgi:hypothetical protein
MLAPRSVSSGTPPVHLACSGHRPSVPSSHVIRVSLTPGLARDLTAEELDLDEFKRSLGSAPPARFDAEGGLRTGSPNDWGPWGWGQDHSERTILAPRLRRPGAGNAPRETSSGRRSGRNWFSWWPKPRAQAASSFQPLTWEARQRQRQVDEAVNGAVVLLVYSAVAFCWWFAHVY